MDIGIFDVLKIGIGPSSSHTVGPMLAARRFRDMLSTSDNRGRLKARAELFGSLAVTGEGHRTTDAICAGLLGLDPAGAPVPDIWQARQAIQQQSGFPLGASFVAFHPERECLRYWAGVWPVYWRNSVVMCCT